MDSNALLSLKSKLPYHYGRQISKNLKGTVSAEQVRLVFSGEITSPDIVEKVIEEALNVAAQKNRIDGLVTKAANS